MKSVLAFAAGMFVGALLVLGTGNWFRLPHLPGVDGSVRIERPFGEWGLPGAVRDGVASLVFDRSRSGPSRVWRWPVSQCVRMARSGVVLVQSAPPAPPLERVIAAGAETLTAALSATPPEDSGPAETSGNMTSGLPAVAVLPSAEPEAAPADPSQSYAAALSSYEAGRFETSREQFAAFLQRFPRHRLVPNALYWTGETWYDQARYDKAAEAFEQVLRDYPRHEKSPDALLKLAYSALRQGKPDKARAYLNRLQAVYPDSRASRLGRQARSRLQGSSESGTMVVRRG